MFAGTVQRNSRRSECHLGVLGIAIGLGSGVAGFVSELQNSPHPDFGGCCGTDPVFALWGAVPPIVPDMSPMWRVLFLSHSGLILGAGFSAGFYIIPLQALLQQLAPEAERGCFLGTANAISFMFLTGSAVLYSVIRPVFAEPEKIFLVCAGLMAAGIVYFLMRVRTGGLTFVAVSSG